MSPWRDMWEPKEENELTWKALSDPTRRLILDELTKGPCTTGELVSRFDFLCRTGVMKHLDVLEQAGLLIVQRKGRVRWNAIDPMPIQHIYQGWFARHIHPATPDISPPKKHVDRTNQPPPSQTK